MWNFMRYVAQVVRERESEDFYNKYAQNIIDYFKDELTNWHTGEIERFPEEEEIVEMIEKYREYDRKLKE